MTPKNFDLFMEKAINDCVGTLRSKEMEYSKDSDRFHNFQVAAAIDDETPERALWGMAKKHLVAIIDILDWNDEGRTYPLHYLREKFGDMRNYLFLLEAMLQERRIKDEAERCEGQAEESENEPTVSPYCDRPRP